MKDNFKRALLIVYLAWLSSCAGPNVAVNLRADFSAIRRVAVSPFSGTGGEAAADMIAQDLLARGADVVERQRLEAVLREQSLSGQGLLDPATVKRVGKILGVDALIVGTVTNYSPGQSYLVYSGGAGTILGATVTPIAGRTVYSQGPAVGVPGSDVVTSAAAVGLVARMVDVETGSVLWSARMTYEGFDVDTAMAAVTGSFADSLVPIWPQLRSLK